MSEENTQEVELRALISREEFDAIGRKLIELGAKTDVTEKVEDTYFCSKEISSFDALEMDDVGSYSLRLRKDSKGSNLNIKVITQSGDHNSWEEHEIAVDSYEQANTILELIGFKSFITIIKARQVYTLNGIRVFLEDIEDFGTALEAEIVTTKDEGEYAKKRIKDLLGQLDISSDRIVPKSISNIIMRQKARF